jgi:hypothetical protein
MFKGKHIQCNKIQYSKIRINLFLEAVRSIPLSATFSDTCE